MKKVNVKDVDVVENEITTKKLNIKKMLIIILMVIVTLVGLFFWSTKVRWNAEIEDYYEVLYYGQESIKIDELTNFYGEQIESSVDSTEALLMYCSSEYGKKCITGDFNDSFENLLRNPSIVINIVILIDLVLLFILFKDKYVSKVCSYILFILVLVLGIFNIGKVVFNFANYYYFVNDTEYVVEGEIIGQLVTNNDSEFYPVVKYTTEQGEFITYIESSLDGQLNSFNSNKITIYYDKIDNSLCTIKESLIKYLLPLIVGILYIILSIFYFMAIRKNN